MTRTALLRLALVPAVIALLSSCASGPAQGGALQEPTIPASSPVATAVPSAAEAIGTAPSAAAPAAAAEEWKRHTVPSGRLSFELPAAWTVTESKPSRGDGEEERGEIALPGSAGPAALKFVVRPYELIGMTGCRAPSFVDGGLRYESLDSRQVPGIKPPSPALLQEKLRSPDGYALRAEFRAVQYADHVGATIGITDDAPDTDCIVTNAVWTGSDAIAVAMGDEYFGFIQAGVPGMDTLPWTFPTMEAARAYMQTAEYKQIMHLLASLSTP